MKKKLYKSVTALCLTVILILSGGGLAECSAAVTDNLQTNAFYNMASSIFETLSSLVERLTATSTKINSLKTDMDTITTSVKNGKQLLADKLGIDTSEGLPTFSLLAQACEDRYTAGYEEGKKDGEPVYIIKNGSPCHYTDIYLTDWGKNGMVWHPEKYGYFYPANGAYDTFYGYMETGGGIYFGDCNGYIRNVSFATDVKWDDIVGKVFLLSYYCRNGNGKKLEAGVVGTDTVARCSFVQNEDYAEFRTDLCDLYIYYNLMIVDSF